MKKTLVRSIKTTQHMGHLREYYERIIKLQESEWEFIAAHFDRRIFNKNEIITKQGRTENYLSFIESGIVRFYIPDDENELTFNFSFNREFTCAYDSFLTQTPSEYELQALTESIVWRISYSDLQKVYAQTQVGNYLGRFASERLFLAKSKRELSLLKYNAKERYLRLFSEQPDILKFIPMKYIASYIGITPQGLSRIRRQIS
jgi:CRP-like cAMP-binding protein